MSSLLQMKDETPGNILDTFLKMYMATVAPVASGVSDQGAKVGLTWMSSKSL